MRLHLIRIEEEALVLQQEVVQAKEMILELQDLQQVDQRIVHLIRLMTVQADVLQSQKLQQEVAQVETIIKRADLHLALQIEPTKEATEVLPKHTALAVAEAAANHPEVLEAVAEVKKEETNIGFK